MAPKGLDMKQIEEIKRLRTLGFSSRKISKCLGVHRLTVKRYLDEDGVISTKVVDTLLEAPVPLLAAPIPWVGHVDWEKVRTDALSGVPLKILHGELVASGATAVQYPAFWKQLSRRAPVSLATMVRIFAPGSRAEIDYADGIDVLDLTTGELLETELFVGVLANSRYAFAEFTLTQSSEDFLSSHVRMLEFFDGVPQTISPDNLKSAVSRAHRYDPVLNPAYTRLAAHYGFAVVPARVKRPKDKAIVERTIQIFQRWFFFLVRHRRFTSIAELNAVLREHLTAFNARTHRIFKRTRREMFEEEKACLLPLPAAPYLVAVHERALLSRDCHLHCRGNYYSAPHSLRGQKLEVWITDKTVEIHAEGARVAFHARSRTSGKYVTDKNHYPPACQAYAEEDVVKLRAWASDIGVDTQRLVHGLLSGEHPLQYLRRAQGILNLSRRHSPEVLERASATANLFNQTHVAYLERVILQQRGAVLEQEGIQRGENPNLRGLSRILH
jgi:transposase